MLNDNIADDSQILPFYLASGSDDSALIRGRIASVGEPASRFSPDTPIRRLLRVFRPKHLRWLRVSPYSKI